MTLRPIGSLTSPVAIVGDLDPTTSTSIRELPLLLRVHCLLRGRLLVPEQFMLFNRRLTRMTSSPKGRAELVEFFRDAPVHISQHNRSRYATCEDHLRAALEEDHPFLVGADIGELKAYARFLDDSIPVSGRVGIDTPAAVVAFPQRFRELAPHFGITPSVVEVVQDLARRASERPGRNESRLGYDTWNRNDVYLILTSDRFDCQAHAISPDLVRAEPTKSTVLACARAAYLGALGEQLSYPDQDVLLPIPDTYDLSHSTLAATTFESATVRAIAKRSKRQALPIEALGSCSWRSISDYMRSGAPEVLAYFHARAAFLNAPHEEKLARLADLGVHLEAYLKRAGDDLVPRSSSRRTVEFTWRGWHDEAKELVRFGLTFLITGATHSLHWFVGGTAHAAVDHAVEVLFSKLPRHPPTPLAATLRASWYSATAATGARRAR